MNACVQNGYQAQGIEPDSNTRNRSIKQFDIKGCKLKIQLLIILQMGLMPF